MTENTPSPEALEAATLAVSEATRLRPMTGKYLSLETLACAFDEFARQAVERERPKAQLRSYWHEDFGEVLWWTFPVQEAPYVGSPLCNDWPGYHTHWTPMPPPPDIPENKP